MKPQITDLPQPPSGDESAFPVDGQYARHAINHGKAGLSKREYFAAKAMQGMCAYPQSTNWTQDEIAKFSVEQADALLKSLEL